MNFMNILFFVAALGAYGASPDAESTDQRHIRTCLGYQTLCTPGRCTPGRCTPGRCTPGNVEDSTVYQSANDQQIEVSYFHEYPRGSECKVKNLTTESSLLVEMSFDKEMNGQTETIIKYKNKEGTQSIAATSYVSTYRDNIGDIVIWGLINEESERWSSNISSLPTIRPATFGTIYTDENSAEVTRYIFRRNTSEGAFLRVRIPYANIYEAEFEWGTETYGKSSTANVVGQRRVFIDKEPSEAFDSDTHSDTSDTSDTKTKGADDTKISDSHCALQ